MSENDKLHRGVCILFCTWYQGINTSSQQSELFLGPLEKRGNGTRVSVVTWSLVESARNGYRFQDLARSCFSMTIQLLN